MGTALGGELDEATLVARARDGDVGAFETLVHAHQRRIFALALRMLRSRSEAEDVTQEVFLTAWRRLPDLRADDAFAGWLYRTATRRCLNLLTRTRSTAELDTEATATPDPDADPADAAMRTQTLAALEEALAHLTPEQRAVWLLREVHDRSYEEIAAAVGATPQAVRGRLARARLQVAEVMAPWR